MKLSVSSVIGAVNLVAFAPPGYRSFGVPRGGAYCSVSASRICQLLELASSADLIEIGLGSLEIETQGTGTLAIVGARHRLSLDGVHARSQCRFPLFGRHRLSISEIQDGARVYLGVSGGFTVNPPLIETRPLGRGDVLNAESLHQVAGALSTAVYADKTEPIRVVTAPQSEAFDLKKFAMQKWTVSPLLDRRGVRLVGASPLPGPEIPSEPAWPGAIQIANDGQPIIIGPDGPTVGGYPKIATVIAADQWRIAQAYPGLEMKFEFVTMSQAVALGP